MPHPANLFKALADPNRLRIMNILSHQGLCVCELQQVLGLPQPFISRHLAYLRKVGLVEREREGARVCYSLAHGTPFIQATQSFLRDALPGFPDFQADLKKLGDSYKSSRYKSYFEDLEPREPNAA